MNFPSHFSFGVFTGLLFYYITQDLVLSILVFFIQIVLILDFLFKKLINFEPLHTLIAAFVSWAVAYYFFPAYHWGIFVAYFSHLGLDLFVEEEIPLFYPFSFLPQYPIEGSEKFVQIVSLLLSFILLLMILV